MTAEGDEPREDKKELVISPDAVFDKRVRLMVKLVCGPRGTRLRVSLWCLHLTPDVD